MAKEIKFNEEARRSLERGVNALADAVKDVYKRQDMEAVIREQLGQKALKKKILL